MKIAQIFKSKTIDFNAGYMALIALVGALGYEIRPEVVAAGATLLNWILRFFTVKPLKEK